MVHKGTIIAIMGIVRAERCQRDKIAMCSNGETAYDIWANWS